jgi:hypothetical protein
MIGRLEMRISRILSTAALLMAVGVHPERCFQSWLRKFGQGYKWRFFSSTA